MINVNLSESKSVNIFVDTTNYETVNVDTLEPEKVEVKVGDIKREIIDVNITDPEKVEVEIKSEVVKVGEYEEYKGDYTVTPRVSEQKLATAEKLLKNDVVVKEIPYAEVSNLTGGKTVTIG